MELLLLIHASVLGAVVAEMYTQTHRKIPFYIGSIAAVALPYLFGFEATSAFLDAGAVSRSSAITSVVIVLIYGVSAGFLATYLCHMFLGAPQQAARHSLQSAT